MLRFFFYEVKAVGKQKENPVTKTLFEPDYLNQLSRESDCLNHFPIVRVAPLHCSFRFRKHYNIKLFSINKIY